MGRGKLKMYTKKSKNDFFPKNCVLGNLNTKYICLQMMPMN